MYIVFCNTMYKKYIYSFYICNFSIFTTDNEFRFNIGHIGVSLGDLGLAYQAFKVCLAVQPGHAEALNNISVLEIKRQKFDLARSCLNSSKEIGSYLYEPHYNSGTLYEIKF